jgi:hypothetical protein
MGDLTLEQMVHLLIDGPRLRDPASGHEYRITGFTTGGNALLTCTTEKRLRAWEVAPLQVGTLAKAMEIVEE